MAETDLILPVVQRPAHCQGCAWFSICGGPNANCKYCSCEGARGCGNCGVRCAYREDEPDWLSDVGGTMEFDIAWPEVALPKNLPSLIPAVVTPVRPMPEWPAYGVRWDRILSRDGMDVQPRWLNGKPYEAMATSPSTLTVASLVGPDQPIEAAWKYQFRNQLWDKIQQCNFDLVLAPNYSVYGDQPRYEHLLNMKRSLLVAERMRRRGIPAVPNVYPFRQADADRVSEWARRVDLDAIVHNCQTYSAPRDWELALTMLIYWRDHMPTGMKWIFSGVSAKNRVQDLRRLFPDCHIMSLWPYEMASHGQRVMADGKREKCPARPPELMAENIRTMASWL